MGRMDIGPRKKQAAFHQARRTQRLDLDPNRGSSEQDEGHGQVGLGGRSCLVYYGNPRQKTRFDFI